MARKKQSIFDRAFRAADAWMRHRPFSDTEGLAAHVGYRCGWYVGYIKGRAEAKRTADTTSERQP